MELFAGAGGLALGLLKAGYSTNVMVEYNRPSCQTLAHNFGQHCEILNEDVRHIDFRQYSGKIDIVSGGPPCQPFSIGGKAKGNGDQRNMFPFAVKAIRDIYPVAFIFENVKGLLRPSFSKYFSYIKLQLTFPEITLRAGEEWEMHMARLEDAYSNYSHYKGLKYNVLHQLLNAANYGVPQKRERVFIVGFRDDLNITWHFPEITHSEEALLYTQNFSMEYWERHKIAPRIVPRKKTEFDLFKVNSLKPWITVRDAIADLPDPKSGKTNLFANHVFQPGARVYTGHTGSLLDEPSKTIKAGDHGVPGGENMVVLDDGTPRYFTIRESARVQTFPDHFTFPGSWTESMRQIGNAVPVELAYTIANSVRNVLAAPTSIYGN